MTHDDAEKLRSMLHAWELGLLSEKEQEEFECLLIENDLLFEEARDFEDAIRLIKTDPDLLREIEAVRPTEKSTDSDAQVTEEVVSRKSRNNWYRIAAVAAVLVLIFVIKDWHFDISFFNEARADANRLAILYFDYSKDTPESADLGQLMTYLLIADLSESQLMQVVNVQRIKDIYQSLDTVGSDRGIEYDMADRLKAKWILTGSIDSSASGIAVSSRLIDARGGEVLASEYVKGTPGQSIFEIVDLLSSDVKKDLFPNSMLENDPDRKVVNLMTSSIDATRMYFRGLDLYDRYYIADAISAFESALKIDSTFAMAYYYLALLKDPGLINEAMRHSDRAGRVDRLFIYSLHAALAGDRVTAIQLLHDILEKSPDVKMAQYYLYVYGDNGGIPGNEISHLNRALELDPLFPHALNGLAFAYCIRGEFDSAIVYVNRYIDVDSVQPNPWDTKGDIYAWFGKPDSAGVFYRKALELDPGFTFSREKIGHLAVFEKDYGYADSLYNSLKQQTLPTNTYHAFGQVRRGNFGRALQLLERSNAVEISDRLSGVDLAGNYAMIGFLHLLRKQYDSAITAFTNAENCVSDNRVEMASFGMYTALAYLDMDDIEHAEIWADSIRSVLYGTKLKDLCSVLDILIENKKGLGVAEDTSFVFNVANPIYPGPMWIFITARAKYELGDLNGALDEIRKAQSSYDRGRLYLSVWDILGYYQSGIMYEALGKPREAIASYETFLDYWGTADWKLDQVEDARERLARLRNRI